MNQKNISWLVKTLFQILQGSLIGVGAVLPGISGGVLCVMFGIYKMIMEVLANPIKHLKTHFPILLPYGVGVVLGFFGIANLLSTVLEKYPAPSVCIFIGLIIGMLPALFKEAGEQGRNIKSFFAIGISMMVVFCVLIGLKVSSITIIPGFGWYVFCGVCLALSVIAPGLSFSTLLMPLGLYEPFIDGIGHFDFEILLPGGMGAFLTVILFAKGVNSLFQHYYSVAFHAIAGVVIAATVMIVPVESFSSPKSSMVNVLCITAGISVAMLLDRVQQKIARE